MDVSTADAWKRSVLMLKQAKLEIAPNPVSVTQPQPAGQKLILLKFPAADIGVCRTRPLSLTPVYGVGAVGLRSVAVRCLSHPAVGEQSSAVLYGCGGGALWFSAPSCLQALVCVPELLEGFLLQKGWRSTQLLLASSFRLWGSVTSKVVMGRALAYYFCLVS